MIDRVRLRLLWVVVFALSRPATGHAQAHHHPAMADTTDLHRARTVAHAHARGRSPGGKQPAGHAGHDMAAMEMDHTSMTGLYGPYAMTREASGTAWQPDAARHEGIHLTRGPWSVMVHGFADLVYDDQGGNRGDTKVFGNNMGMGVAQRALGTGTFGLRAMLSLEPATIGKEGYPLLLQTGETADGRTRLIDRQHPHDLFMELAGSYSVASGNRSLFVYAGLPGEPALGPPAFMHRSSGRDIPSAPITHHWLDSTHITFGVLTGGAVIDRIKVEASAFRGREPDQDRWNIETPKLDSHAFRASANPTGHWTLQLSYGRLKSPEQLEPDVDQDRTTASATYAGALGDAAHWDGTVAWGRTRNRPGHQLDAFTAEAAVEIGGRHTWFGRLERVEKDELFPEADPLAGQVFEVGELTGGYRFDFWRRGHVRAGAGAAGTLSQVPRALRDVYGESPLSGLLVARLTLQ